MGDDTIQCLNLKNCEKSLCKLQPAKNKYPNSEIYKGGSLIGPRRLVLNKRKKQLYSLNSYDDSISIVDLDSFAVEKTIYIGSYPNDGILHGNFVLATNGDSDSVSVFDIDTERIIEQIKVGSQPQDILYNKKYNKIVVSNMNSDTVSIIDPLKYDVVKVIVVGLKPCGMCFSEDEEYLYVANTYLESGTNGTVSVVNMHDLRCIDDIEVGKMPTSVCTKNDFLYVINSCSNTMSKINIKTKEKKEIFCGYMPTYLYLRGKTAYVSTTGENKLLIINTEKLEIVKTIETGREPEGLIVDL